MDTGHHLLCGWYWMFMPALLDARANVSKVQSLALSERAPELFMVRLRREPFHTAKSLCHRPGVDLFGKMNQPPHINLNWGLTPSTDCVLPLNAADYRALSCFQRALWEILELEARYQVGVRTDLLHHPRIQLHEVNWNSNFSSVATSLHELLPDIFLKNTGDGKLPNGSPHIKNSHEMPNEAEMMQSQTREVMTLIERRLEEKKEHFCH